ncbi:hypothetical protein K6L09_41615 [Burkholderia cepacia]
MKRMATYKGWTIDAAPIILARQRLFQSCAIVEREHGERFVFVDLGNRVFRSQAHARGIEWAMRWIDNNYSYGAAGRRDRGVEV